MGATVDEEDYDRVMQLGPWYYSWNGYAYAHYYTPEFPGRCLFLHKVVFYGGLGEGPMLDHHDLDKLNCRKSNIRPSNKSLNSANRGLQSNNTSGYKGVHFFKRLGKFQAHIGFGNKKIHLGTFLTADEAALAYNKSALSLFGEYAKLNAVGGDQ